ncbi:hypothetical protein VIGAN_02260300 [Vigna angularis var. angularis]|uniref:Secreted protein n=1 Tax=Vigna angularis var. angularis TaxID=157739 RepID=A0A0S3RGC9_PHAAN|nr:hypothetical protein VIGAN_02260300 [Vigna angularis var. angularis]
MMVRTTTTHAFSMLTSLHCFLTPASTPPLHESQSRHIFSSLLLQTLQSESSTAAPAFGASHNVPFSLNPHCSGGLQHPNCL